MATELPSLNYCRQCEGEFSFTISQDTVRVIAGPPAENIKYVAISYVWGEVTDLVVKCKACAAETVFPMSSLAKLKKLLKLGRAVGLVWLDALSIDQKDHADISRQVAIMGDIYKNAVYVAVLLPSQDAMQFQQLSLALEAAEALLKKRRCFDRNSELVENSEITTITDSHQRLRYSDERGIYLEDYTPPTFEFLIGPPCGVLCRQYFESIAQFKTHMPHSVYWTRAWTFQEWVMAHDLNIEYESSDGVLLALKSTIIKTMLMIATYKLDNGQYAQIDVGIRKSGVLPWLNMIKSLFPCESLFLADSEIDEERLRNQLLFPHFQFDQILGICSKPLPAGQQSLSVRLQMLADTYGQHKRKARYEADLICCWASMCNIEYGYSKDDSLAVAVQKITTAIRQLGLRIYNFVVNTDGACAELDLCFLDYFYHTNSGDPDGRRIPGVPIFSGIMDTAQHFENLVNVRWPLPKFQGQGVPVRKVKGAAVTPKILLSDCRGFLESFNKVVIPSPSLSSVLFGGELRSHPLKTIEMVLAGLGPEICKDNYAFLTVRIQGLSYRDTPVSLWTVIPALYENEDIFVAREAINGTLVLTAGADQANVHVLAYLVFTDEAAGSQLISVNEDGNFSLGQTQRFRSEFLSGFGPEARKISGWMEIEDSVAIAFGG